MNFKANHLNISLIKSGIRIFSALALGMGAFAMAGIGFLVAEIFGIVEELVDTE
jgi:hypothetical protein